MKVTKTGIAKNISEILENQEPRMTIKKLAEESGVGESTLKMVVCDTPDSNGKKRKLNTDDLFDIAEALDVSIYKLLTGNDDENHSACEELGLSNNSVEKLKYLAVLNKRGKTNIVSKMIDILLDNQQLLVFMYLYLTGKAQKKKMLSEDECVLLEEGVFTSDDFPFMDESRLEALEEMTIMDMIRDIKRDMNGGNKK